MKKLLYLSIWLFFLQCTGEISVDWGIEWELTSESGKSFSTMEYEFSANNIGAEFDFYNRPIDDTGFLESTFSVYDYNHKGVTETYPNIEFVFILKEDTTTLMDTVFTWQEMEFVGNVSKKELTIP